MDKIKRFRGIERKFSAYRYYTIPGLKFNPRAAIPEFSLRDIVYNFVFIIEPAGEIEYS